jgi:hypothetical protein
VGECFFVYECRFLPIIDVDAIMCDTDRAVALRSEWKNIFEAFPEKKDLS